MASAAKSSDEYFVVLVDIIETPVSRHKGGNLFPVLNQLHAHAFPDSRVRLLGFNANFLENDAFCVRCTPKGLGVLRNVVRFGISLVRPLLRATVRSELAASAQSVRLT